MRRYVIKGFLSHAIAGAKKSLALIGPNGKGEHADKPRETLGAPMREGLQQYFGVGASAECGSFCQEFLAQTVKIIDLAVESDDEAPVTRDKRLVGLRRKI